MQSIFDIASVAPALRMDEDGIWVAKDARTISYPEDGNDDCFLVEDSSYWFRHRNELIHGLCDKFSPDSIFYDIGGGNGAVTKYLCDKGKSCILVEPGRVGAMNARHRGIRNVIQSTLEDAGFLKNSIDDVGLFDVVEHIQDDKRFLNQINLFQKSDSFLFLTVPSSMLLWSNEDVRAGHFRRYTKRTLEHLLNSTGYEVRFCSYFFSFLTLPIFMFRTMPSLLGLRKETGVKVMIREHSEPNKLVKRVLNQLVCYEQSRIQRGRKILIGSSLIAVAQKQR